jgi:hypothetical protein
MFNLKLVGELRKEVDLLRLDVQRLEIKLENDTQRLENSYREQVVQLTDTLDKTCMLYSKIVKRFDGMQGGRPANSKQLPPIIPGQPYPHGG